MIFLAALKYRVATLNVCLYVMATDALYCGDEIFHRQPTVAAHIDTPQKGNEGVHRVSNFSPIIQCAQRPRSAAAGARSAEGTLTAPAVKAVGCSALFGQIPLIPF